MAKAVLDGRDSFLGRHIIGEDPIPPERLWARLYNTVLHSNRRGWELICIGAVDVALWDIFGKALRKPVYQLLGGAERAAHQVWSIADQRREAAPILHDYLTRLGSRERPDTTDRKACAIARDGLSSDEDRTDAFNTGGLIVELDEVEHAQALRASTGFLCGRRCQRLWNDVGMALTAIDRVKEYDVFFFETPFPAESLDAYARLTSKCLAAHRRRASITAFMMGIPRAY